jgi:glucosamine--fructose-6-phosphate aminotransferase (isomerizing)
MVIGRGAGFAIAQEAALKLKETSAIQAEAFSSAEVRHGPMALIDEITRCWCSPHAVPNRPA